jgi:hypothetical protein
MNEEFIKLMLALTLCFTAFFIAFHIVNKRNKDEND